MRQGPFVPGESYERLDTRTASGILPSVQKIVEFPLLGAIEERVEFQYRVGENGAPGMLGVSDHDDVAAPRHLDAVSLAALSGRPP